MNIEELIEEYKKIGYKYEEAQAKVCQDIIILKISKSKYSANITIKGGVVMHNISDNVRRATRDLDLDFIKYSLADNSIITFIDTLNKVDDGVEILINGKISPLHHQDYDGKRVLVRLEDKFNNFLETKIDIGVHKEFDINQEMYCFDLQVIKESANLLINSKEQIFVEKLKSLLKLGFRSTRYKDLFDFYYLINIVGLDKDKVSKYIDVLIIHDIKVREKSITDIYNRLKLTLNSPRYRKNLNNPKVNWLDVSVDSAIESLLDYIKKLEFVSV